MVELEDVNIKEVTLTSCATPILLRNITCCSAIYRLTIDSHPLAHLSHALDSNLRKFTIGLRTYIEQQVSTLTRCTNEVADERIGRFIVLVYNLIAPHTIHCLASLEGQLTDILTRKTMRVLTWEVTLKNLNILTLERCHMVVIRYHA